VTVTGKASTASGTPLKAKTRLPSGSTVQTEPDATVTLRIGNLAAVLVKPGSRITPTLQKDGAWELALETGAVLSHVNNPSHRPGVFRIHTPSAVMGVRGTSFYSAVDAEGGALLCACHGTVAVAAGQAAKASEFKGQNHDQQKRFFKSQTLKADLAGTHSEEEIQTLKATLKP
jgi:hypothetical protein